MKLVNKTKNKVVAEEIEKLNSHLAQAKGLLGEKKKGRAVYFKTRFGIHTFGMKFPIDCAVLDDGFVVRAVRESMGPGRCFFWNLKYKNVIELPARTLAYTETTIGDVLTLE